MLREHRFNVGDRKYTIHNFETDTLIGPEIDRTGTWEPWQISIYSRLLRPGDVCLDIGANIGTSAIAMAQYVGKAGRVYSFEPVPLIFDVLRKNVADNRIGNIVPVNLGISNRRGSATFVVDREKPGTTHETAATQQFEESRYLKSSVDIDTLDSWRAVNHPKSVRLIKVDVESFETQVIQGGRKSFADRDTVCIFEFGVEPATRGQSIPHELAFYNLLAELFPVIHLIGRDSRLYPVTSYAHLRALMSRGYQVEDLLCCHSLPKGLRDCVADSVFLPEGLPMFASISLARSILFVNMYNDGWAAQTREFNTGSISLFVKQDSAAALALSFLPIHVKEAGLATARVLICHGKRHQYLDLTNKPGKVAIDLLKGANWIFLESEAVFSALDYWGDARDQRRIGFNLKVM